jgi:hypothetical protein
VKSGLNISRALMTTHPFASPLRFQLLGILGRGADAAHDMCQDPY